MRHSGSCLARAGRIVATATLCLIVTSCAGVNPKDTLPTVPSVDLARYAGTWYEIARLPMWFQRHCVDSKAIYTSRSDGAVGVHNECVTDSGGVEQAEGVATVVDDKTNARLNVVFDNYFARLFGTYFDDPELTTTGECLAYRRGEEARTHAGLSNDRSVRQSTLQSASAWPSLISADADVTCRLRTPL